MSLAEVGTCRHQDCGQTDLLWEDGYCTQDCRAQATGCEVPLCGFAGDCMVTPGSAPPEDGGAP